VGNRLHGQVVTLEKAENKMVKCAEVYKMLMMFVKGSGFTWTFRRKRRKVETALGARCMSLGQGCV
jgi:hypothetical protein